jgi:hypothetical protein
LARSPNDQVLTILMALIVAVLGDLGPLLHAQMSENRLTAGNLPMSVDTRTFRDIMKVGVRPKGCALLRAVR